VEEKSAKKETDEGAQCTDDIASPTELNEMPEKFFLGFNAVPEKLHWKATV
jgi:hypothetical protein